MTNHDTLTLSFRHEDPQIRDQAAATVLDIARNALNYQSIGGLTFPAWTFLRGGNWEPPVAPERKITCDFTYQYLVEGGNSFDVSEPEP